MDAFAVSVCKGLSVRALRPRHALACGLWFGAFQALMPTVGYLLGVSFQSLIENVDHWIAFVLLALIGGNMIREALHGDDDDEVSAEFGPRAMLPLAVATSIDALAVGVTFAFLQVNLAPAVACIGIITCVIAIVGVCVGHAFGLRFKARAEVAGGVVLILIGLKILLEHLGVLAL